MRTFGTVKFKENHWIFDDVEPHVMIRIKKVFPKIPTSQVCPFALLHSRELSLDIEWFLQRYPMKVSESDMSYLLSEKRAQLEFNAEFEAFKKPDYIPMSFDLKKPLRNYQSLGVEYFLKSKRVLNGDVTGLGKTPLAIASILGQSQRPALVTMQTHMPDQWVQKIKEFSNLSVHVIKTGKNYPLPAADVYICTYSKLAKWVDVFTSGIVKTFVCDEIQEFRKSDSDKYMAGKNIADKCEYVLGLSATPIYNYGDETWNIFNLIKENCLDTKYNFVREWCKNDREVRNPQALGSYLREQNLFLRRTRSEVGRELPPLNTIVETVDFDELALKKVEDLAKTLAVKVMNGSFVEKGMAARELDMLVRHATGVSKAKFVAAYVRMLIEAGEPVLLAGWHRDVYDIWLEELKDLKPVMYTGSETPKQKEESKRKFISGESSLMIISLRSGVGLDGLQERCSVVVIGELDWSPQVHTQIIGRIDRDKQDGVNNNVTVIYLTTNSGSDPAIIDMLGVKSSQAKGIVDPFSGVETVNQDETRIKKIAQLYLKGQTVEKKIKTFSESEPAQSFLEGLDENA